MSPEVLNPPSLAPRQYIAGHQYGPGDDVIEIQGDSVAVGQVMLYSQCTFSAVGILKCQ